MLQFEHRNNKDLKRSCSNRGCLRFFSAFKGLKDPFSVPDSNEPLIILEEPILCVQVNHRKAPSALVMLTQQREG